MNKIGYGTANYFATDIKHIDLLKFVFDCGITFFDTAEMYLGGRAEDFLGQAFEKNREQIFISTKAHSWNAGFLELIEAAKRSMHRLRTDYIDLYQIHWPNPNVSLNETLDAMWYLKDKGMIKFAGLSNHTYRDLLSVQTGTHQIDYMQNEYNLFDRTLENTTIKNCENNNIKFIAWGPVDKGRQKNDQFLIDIANKYNKTVSQIILSWFNRYKCVIPVFASLSEKHIKENTEIDFELDEDDINNINIKYNNVVEYIRIKDICCENYKEGEYNPDPKDMAKFLVEHTTDNYKISENLLKPIRITNDKMLLEGKSRYWACQIAFGEDSLIPCLIR